MIDGWKKRIVKELGIKLKKVREARNLSLRDLAAETGLEHAQISRIEDGQVNPTVTTIRLLEEALGVDPGELLRP